MCACICVWSPENHNLQEIARPARLQTRAPVESKELNFAFFPSQEHARGEQNYTHQWLYIQEDVGGTNGVERKLIESQG